MQNRNSLNHLHLLYMHIIQHAAREEEGKSIYLYPMTPGSHCVNIYLTRSNLILIVWTHDSSCSVSKAFYVHPSTSTKCPKSKLVIKAGHFGPGINAGVP